MQAVSRTLVVPPVSSREAFAELDARKDLQLSAAELIAEHTGNTEYFLPLVQKESEGGTGERAEVELTPDNYVQLYASGVCWYTPHEARELATKLHVAADAAERNTKEAS